MRRAHGRYEPSEILFEEDARVPTNVLRQSAYLGAQHCAQAQFAIANERTAESIGVVRHCFFRSAVKAARLAELLNKTFSVAFGNGNADIGLGWEIVVDACGLYADSVSDVAGAEGVIPSRADHRLGHVEDLVLTATACPMMIPSLVERGSPNEALVAHAGCDGVGCHQSQGSEYVQRPPGYVHTCLLKASNASLRLLETTKRQHS